MNAETAMQLILDNVKDAKNAGYGGVSEPLLKRLPYSENLIEKLKILGYTVKNRLFSNKVIIWNDSKPVALYWRSS